MRKSKYNRGKRRPRTQTLEKLQGQPSSCITTLTTPELLERILLLLDMRTLLVSAQSVCISWNELITTSTALQRRLFMALPSSEYSEIEPAPEQILGLNPLLLQAFNPLFSLTSTRLGYPYDRVPGAVLSASSLLKAGLPITDNKNNRKRHHAFTRKGASWRSMFISNRMFVNIYYKKSDSEGGDISHHRFSFPEGLRMGQLWDLIWKVLWSNQTKANNECHAGIFWEPRRQLDLAQEIAKDMSSGQAYDPRDIDLYIREVRVQHARPGTSNCNNYHHAGAEHNCPRIDRDWRLRQSSAWMFKCEDYEESVHVWTSN